MSCAINLKDTAARANQQRSRDKQDVDEGDGEFQLTPDQTQRCLGHVNLHAPGKKKDLAR